MGKGHLWLHCCVQARMQPQQGTATRHEVCPDLDLTTVHKHKTNLHCQALHKQDLEHTSALAEPLKGKGNDGAEARELSDSLSCHIVCVLLLCSRTWSRTLPQCQPCSVDTTEPNIGLQMLSDCAVQVAVGILRSAALPHSASTTQCTSVTRLSHKAPASPPHFKPLQPPHTHSLKTLLKALLSQQPPK